MTDRKIHRPRHGVRDEILATFHPRCFNQWNARISPMFLRKHRGPRQFAHRYIMARMWRDLTTWRKQP